VDDYNNAWKANSAVANTPQQPGPSTAAGPSTSVTMSINQGSGTLTPPYGFQQPGPCIPYGYYTFFQQQHPSSGSNAHNTPTSNTPDPGGHHNHHTNNTNNSSTTTLMKRPFTFAGDRGGGGGSGVINTDVVILEPSQKRTRHCCKCGSQECKGKGGRSFCMNACQDCGKLDCKGRNSRRPDKRCDEAWS
jgi:hypothetical protein